MAELHVFGHLIGARNFQNQNLSCKWTLRTPTNWRLVEGLSEGQTQLDCPKLQDTYFCHPIDIHLLASGLQGWPKLELEVWRQDFYGRSYLESYGFLHLPSEPGHHRIECPTWKPVGSYLDQIYTLFASGALRLQDTTVVCEGDDRFRLQTEASGNLILELYILMRNFDRFGVSASTAAQ